MVIFVSNNSFSFFLFYWIVDIYCVFLLQENPEFDLHFEKIYKWVASSTAEKNAFISCIWKLNQRYLRKKIDFVNVSSQLLEGKVK